MKKIVFCILTACSVNFSCQAQIGVVTIGMSSIGKDGVATPENIGFANTLKCTIPGPCNTLTPVYHFTGNGLWSIDGNWEAGIKPPERLSSTATILIDPVPNGECLLNVPQQIITSGAVIKVAANKKFRIPESVK